MQCIIILDNAPFVCRWKQYEVTDCDIYASFHGIYLGHGQSTLFNSASVGIVARNTVNFGGDCYQIDSSSHVIFEANECVGINLFSRGSAAGSTYGGPASSFIFFARNSIRFVFGGDQEELTLDGGFSPYFGSVESSGEKLNALFNFMTPMKSGELPRQAQDKRKDSSQKGVADNVISHRDEPDLWGGSSLSAVVLAAGALPRPQHELDRRGRLCARWDGSGSAARL